MSVLWAGGNMRGPRLRTPVSVLLLLLLGIGLSHTEDELQNEETHATVEAEDENTETEQVTSDPFDDDLSSTLIPTTNDTENGEEHGSGENGKKGRSSDLGADPPGSTDEDSEETPVEEGLDLMVIIIPVVLVVLFIIVCAIFFHCRMNSQARHSEVSKEDPYLECSSTEKVPMPMFEEDVPSVLELEMDELDDWMKKDGETADGSKQA